jgi:DNA-binding NtrC family response regulator
MISSSEPLIKHDIRSHNPFIKTCKTTFIQSVINELSKLNLENSLLFIWGEKGTEKEEIIKIIVKKYLPCSVVELTDDFPKKKLPFSGTNTFYIIKNVENIEPSILNLFFNDSIKFISAIFLSDNEPEELYRQGKITYETYNLLSKVYKIYIPPLRERKNDIIPLANYFLDEISRFLNLKPKELSREAKEALLEYQWIENAHQLKQYLTKAFLLAKHQKLTPKDIFGEQNDKLSIRNFLELKIGKLIKDFANIENSNLYDTVIQEVEKALFSLVLDETGQNQLKASKVLGINRNTLNKKLKIYNLI